MRMTVPCELALMALIACALVPDRIIRKKDISMIYEISPNHMSQIIHRLAVEGFVKTYRGRYGGIQLAKPPEKIILADVMKIFLNGDKSEETCEDESNLPLRIIRWRTNRIWQKGVVGFYQALKGVSLADLLVSDK